MSDRPDTMIAPRELDVLRSYLPLRGWPPGMSTETFGDIRERLQKRGLLAIVENKKTARRVRLTEAGSALLAACEQQQPTGEKAS